MRPTKGYRQVGTAKVGQRSKAVHRLRAEAALGKPLPPGAVVHHVDGTKSETSLLVICESNAYHLLLHARARVVAVGGNPSTQRICSHCRKLKLFSEMKHPTRQRGEWCRDCVSTAYYRGKPTYSAAYD